MQYHYLFVFIVLSSSLTVSLAMEDHAAMNMTSDHSKDPCYQVGKECDKCLNAGCYWCTKSQGESFCTSASTAEKAECALPGCSNDIFVASLAMCSGGCGSGVNCGDCASIPGCGWCHSSETGPTGCQEIPRSKAVPAQCQAEEMWGVGYKGCTTFCMDRDSQESCIDGSRPCVWDSVLAKCRSANSSIVSNTASKAPEPNTEAPKPNTEAPKPSTEAPKPIEDAKAQHSDHSAAPDNSAHVKVSNDKVQPIDVNTQKEPGHAVKTYDDSLAAQHSTLSIIFIMGVGTAIGLAVYKKM